MQRQLRWSLLVVAAVTSISPSLYASNATDLVDFDATICGVQTSLVIKDFQEAIAACEDSTGLQLFVNMPFPPKNVFNLVGDATDKQTPFGAFMHILLTGQAAGLNLKFAYDGSNPMSLAGQLIRVKEELIEEKNSLASAQESLAKFLEENRQKEKYILGIVSEHKLSENALESLKIENSLAQEKILEMEEELERVKAQCQASVRSYYDVPTQSLTPLFDEGPLLLTRLATEEEIRFLQTRPQRSHIVQRLKRLELHLASF